MPGAGGRDGNEGRGAQPEAADPDAQPAGVPEDGDRGAGGRSVTNDQPAAAETALQELLARSQKLTVQATTSQELKELSKTATVDETRNWIAIGLAGVYAAVVLIVSLFFAMKSSPIPSNDRSVLDPYATALVDVLKVGVLPVITFMLGFYFQSEKSKSS